MLTFSDTIVSQMAFTLVRISVPVLGLLVLGNAAELSEISPELFNDSFLEIETDGVSFVEPRQRVAEDLQDYSGQKEVTESNRESFDSSLPHKKNAVLDHAQVAAAPIGSAGFISYPAVLAAEEAAGDATGALPHDDTELAAKALEEVKILVPDVGGAIAAGLAEQIVSRSQMEKEVVVKPRIYGGKIVLFLTLLSVLGYLSIIFLDKDMPSDIAYLLYVQLIPISIVIVGALCVFVYTVIRRMWWILVHKNNYELALAELAKNLVEERANLASGSPRKSPRTAEWKFKKSGVPW